MQTKLFYLNSKGEKLCAVLTDPGDNADKPIMVLCHGFASSKESKSITALEESYNGRGVSTFKIDLFAHGESQGKFEDLTVTEAVDDILRAISFLKSKGYRHVGLLGSSFGGLAANIAASKSHDLFALILKSPVSDYLELFLNEYGEGGIMKWKHEGVSLRHGRNLKYAFFEDAVKYSGYETGKKIMVPTLIIHGDRDNVVPVEQSKKLAAIIPGCRLEIISGAGHRYSEAPEHFEQMVGAALGFVGEPASSSS